MATHLTQAWIQRVEEMSREVESIATDVRKQKEELEEVPQTLSRYKNFLRGARFQASSVGLTSLQNSFAVWEGLCQVFENTPTYLECTALIHALHLGIEKCQDFLRNDLAERPEVGYVEELRQAAVVSSYNTLTFTARTCLSGVAVSPDQLALQESVELFQFCLDQLEQQFGTDEAMVETTIRSMVQQPNLVLFHTSNLEALAADVYRLISNSENLGYLSESGCLDFMVPAQSST